jgi:O-antigen ligase
MNKFDFAISAISRESLFIPYSLVMSRVAVIKRSSTVLLVVGPATTLTISPFSNFDPINPAKMIIVSSCAFGLLFLLIGDIKHHLAKLPLGIPLVSIVFISWMSIVLFVTGAPINQQFWGVFGRNNGYLGYFCLLVILLAIALIQEKRFYHKLVDVLVLTAAPMTVYALVQLAGRDPVSWSFMAPFATLGNVNFSSAFFGLASISATVLALAPKQNPYLRVFLLAMVAVDLFIILETGSIQGFMIYIAGMGFAGFFFVRAYKPLKILQIPYLFLGIVGFAFTALALNNIGPLARFIFGETILFRFDYWYAGWAMTLGNPVFGVGLDSYGDWYREVRGELATWRTTPDRITNTAHNIYLDISASGGFPLIAAYLFLLGYAFRAAWRLTRRENAFNPYFVALFSTWIAYLIQAAISINQIGVGIWGWLFTGALIGYEIATRKDATIRPERKTKIDGPQLPASVALLGMVGVGVGFILAFVPFNADARFKDALQTGNPVEQFTQSKALGATAYHMELALDAAIKANNEPLASEIVIELLDRYPRDFMGWQVRQILSSTTPEDRERAYERLKEMDPFNPNVQRAG